MLPQYKFDSCNHHQNSPLQLNGITGSWYDSIGSSILPCGTNLCQSDGIGSLGGFKIRCPKGCVGSSPTSGTNIEEYIMFDYAIGNSYLIQNSDLKNLQWDKKSRKWIHTSLPYLSFSSRRQARVKIKSLLGTLNIDVFIKPKTSVEYISLKGVIHNEEIQIESLT